MANEENLIPLNERSKEEARKIQTAGGIARGQQRRDRKTMREWAEAFGNTSMKVKLPDGTEADTTLLGNIVAAQMAKATKGDTKAAKFVADLMGEMEQKLNIEGPKMLVVSEKSIQAADKWAKKDE